MALALLLPLVGARFTALIFVALGLLPTRAWPRLGLLFFAGAGSARALLIDISLGLALLALVA